MFSFSFYGIQLALSATKCNDGHSGLVRVRGWSTAVSSGKTVAFTILDEDDQQGWTRLIDGGLSRSHAEPLEVNIPRSSIGHRIKVTAKVLKSRPGGVVGGVEHLEVASEGSCSATEEMVGVDANSLSYLLSGMSVSSAESHQISNTLQVSIEQATTFSKANVTIGHTSAYPTHFVISIRPAQRNPYASCTEHVFILRRQGLGFHQHFDFPIIFKAGRKYQIDVQGLDLSSQLSTFVENCNFRIVGSGSAEFKAELTITDLNTLHAKAIEHVRPHLYCTRDSARCDYLYRNKPQPYFDDIFQNHGGLMEVYIKDNSGDPGSPINGRIHGLFFMASVEPGSITGQPTRVSAFGGTRLVIPAGTLLQKASNLYFADFYCMRGQFHYVTLVMTRPGSDTDLFCSQRLPSLSLYDSSRNPFLFYDGNSQLQVSTRDHLHVELLFTENLDINQYRYNLKCNTPLIGKGQSTPGGIPKKANCTTCNISPSPGYNPFSIAYLSDDF